MFVKFICVVIFASSVLSRNVPNFRHLDEDDQMLFKAAYDSYDNPPFHDTYTSYDNDIPAGKLDLLKDGMWALKVKMNELKVFNKALAANLLLTKIQVKELLAHHLKPLKTHQHMEIDKKPSYNYQPSPQSSYLQKDTPSSHYNSPAPQYNAPTPYYSAQHYGAPQPVHDPYYGH